jgi:hypothetical protein
MLMRRRQKKAGDPQVAEGRSWLGTSAGFQFDKKFVDLISLFAGDEARQALQALSWANLPILNEWHRRWPDRDPVRLHEEYWHTRLVCPGGGEYVCSAEWQTMESTVYGHPAQPKRGPANVTLTFLSPFVPGSAQCSMKMNAPTRGRNAKGRETERRSAGAGAFHGPIARIAWRQTPRCGRR